MALQYFPGSWNDVCATPDGWGLVSVQADGSVIAYENGVEIWTAALAGGVSGFPAFIRCACNAAGVIHAICTIEVGGTHDEAYLVTSGGMTALGVTTYGERAVMITVEAGVFVRYICDSGTTYLRWPTGSGSTSFPNPFTNGTVLGMLNVVATEPVWAESETTPGTRYTQSFNGVVFQQPMSSGGMTVGQLVGEPVTSEGVAAAGGMVMSTVVDAQAFDPHIAALGGGRFVVATRLAEDVAGDGVALLVAPPWPAFTGVMTHPTTPMPVQHPVQDAQTKLVTKPWEAFFRNMRNSVDGATAQALTTQELANDLVGFGRLAVPGEGTISADDPNALLTLTSDDGSVELVTDPLTKTLDLAVSASVISQALRPGPPGLDGASAPDATFWYPPSAASQPQPVTAAYVESLGYWSPLTNGDPVTPELVFASGDTISVWTPTP